MNSDVTLLIKHQKNGKWQYHVCFKGKYFPVTEFIFSPFEILRNLAHWLVAAGPILHDTDRSSGLLTPALQFCNEQFCCVLANQKLFQANFRGKNVIYRPWLVYREKTLFCPRSWMYGFRPRFTHSRNWVSKYIYVSSTSPTPLNVPTPQTSISIKCANRLERLAFGNICKVPCFHCQSNVNSFNVVACAVDNIEMNDCDNCLLLAHANFPMIQASLMRSKHTIGCIQHLLVHLFFVGISLLLSLGVLDMLVYTSNSTYTTSHSTQPVHVPLELTCRQ